MQNDNLYDMIFKRKSIRKYDMKGIESEKLEEIRLFIQGIKPLDNAIKTQFTVIDEDAAKGGLFSIKAPHYVAVCSEPKGDYLMNAGFMLQQIDLFLAKNGIGACWLGMTKPNKEFALENGMEFIIVLAFGLPAEPLYRTSLAEFKRKSLDEMTNLEGLKENLELTAILEAGRLAPSATNSQPWFFSGTAEAIQFNRLRLNPLKLFIYNKMNQIDIGICLCHIWMSAEKIGKKVGFIKESSEQAKPPKGYDYMITAKISNLI